MEQLFHPAVSAWFRRQLGDASEPQLQGWPAIQAGAHTLIAAPTGSGKTLAAFLAAIDDLVRQGLAGTLSDETQVVYVSPLKALSNDIDRNLRSPLEGIREELRARGLADVEIRTALRTGDTTAAQRNAITKRPPHILVTTPETLYLMLTSESGRRTLQTARSVIVDEIHALVRDKRGSHLALSLERLDRLAQRKLTRIGLSATQRPIEDVARFLVGSENATHDVAPSCYIVDCGHRRDMRLSIELPRSPLDAVMAGEVWEEIYDRLAELARTHKTTLVFVNTRRLAERVGKHLGDRLGEDKVKSHHGSLSRERRFQAEQALKAGELTVLVATASLELGIDVGAVDLVCQLGSTRSIAGFLQRAGRSGHFKGGVPDGRLFPLSRDDLVECVALVDAVRHKQLDRVRVPQAPLDILAQQVVAATACEEWTSAELFDCMRGATPFAALTRERFDAVIDMLADGFVTGRGRRAALIHHDRVNDKLRARKGTRLVALTSGGAIPETADYEVTLQSTGVRVGSVHEDFAVEAMIGDIFQLGNTAWRVQRVEKGKMWVEDAGGHPPTIPFWLGEAPGRTNELSLAVSNLRARFEQRVTEVGPLPLRDELVERTGVSEVGATQLVEYLHASHAALGCLPTQDAIVIERFFDEAGGTQLVIHAPYGVRINRAFGLALRKRFCRTFNFELQAAASDDSIVLSLGPTHSFPLEDVPKLLRSTNAREVLIQALLDAPMFETRFRWNANRSLAVPRFRGGKKVAPFLQRMLANDLLAVAFPDAQACLENIPGDREIPDHPLVQQTIDDCLTEAMDIDGLVTLLSSLESGRVQVVYRELTEASPLSHEILNARPYAFLDDAPLEERRTQAVMSRRFLTADDAQKLGALDDAAIDRVRDQAWPECVSADELYEALTLVGCMTFYEMQRFDAGWIEILVAARRIASFKIGNMLLWTNAERMMEVQAIFGTVTLSPTIEPAPRRTPRTWTREDALKEIVRSRLEASGPTTAQSLMACLGLTARDGDAPLYALEAEGAIMRGYFTPHLGEIEWCERRLLARIHHYTLDRLRKEIAPVSSQDFMRFLCAWHHLDTAHQVKGPASLPQVLARLDGFEAPAVAWEKDLLPARVSDYDPSWLDAQCLSGAIVWARLSASGGSLRRPIRSSPLSLMARQDQAALRCLVTRTETAALSANAQHVREVLQQRGACFATDLRQATGLLAAQLEEALAELVSNGLATADGYAGLRALLAKTSQRGDLRRGYVTGGIDSGGRWSLLTDTQTIDREHAVEVLARKLLQRYGVVFRKLLEREPSEPWRDLLRAYRRMEARGEVRGGRFVDGFTGEQFALPDAVSALRQTRRQAAKTEHAREWISISAADPLNLVGIIVPGDRVAAKTSNRILLRDGLPVAVLEAKQVRFLQTLDPADQWQANLALRRKHIATGVIPATPH